MPAIKEKFSRGVNVYIIEATADMQRHNFHPVNEENEGNIYTCMGGVTYDGIGNKAIDVANVGSLEQMPPGVHVHRVKLSSVIPCEEYHTLKGIEFKETKDPIDIGSIIILANQGERLVYAKVLNVESTKYGDQYEIMPSGGNASHKVRRNDISMPSEAYNTRDVLLKKKVLDYSKGSDAQIIGNFLYIGGDDILVHEKYATNKKII